MNKEIYKQIHDEINKANSIAIISHRSPDGDALGSTTALCEAISINFSPKKISTINVDDIPKNLLFLPNSKKIKKDFLIDEYDLIIMVDVGSFKLSGFGDDKSVFRDKILINIDHHVTNEFYADINLVNTSKPSATAVLYDLFISMGYKINKNIALSLLTGIYTDTGSFIYSNVTPQTFTASSKLINIGGDPALINNEFFSNNSFEFLKIYSLVLERLSLKDNYAISYVKNEDLENFKCSNNDLGSIVSRLNELEGVDYVIFLSEKGNMAKGALRTTKEDIDLTKIAFKFGGGGHKKASAFMIEGTIEADNGRICIKKESGEIIYFT